MQAQVATWTLTTSALSLGSHYITATYTELFFQWKQQTGSPANEMTFNAVHNKTRPICAPQQRAPN